MSQIHIYVTFGVQMSGEVGHETARTVRKYASLDEKVELLIERMSECVRFVREYMQSRMSKQQFGDKQVFGLMLRDFPPCIEKLARIQGEIKRVRLRGGNSKSATDVEAQNRAGYGTSRGL